MGHEFMYKYNEVERSEGTKCTFQSMFQEVRAVLTRAFWEMRPFVHSRRRRPL